MPSGQDRDVTGLLRAWSDGEPGAFDRLVPLVYAELRHLAHRRLRGEPVGHSLQTTALVHEAYLRLVDTTEVTWQNRAQFFAVSAQVMRHVLVDAARARRAAKRGGGAVHVPLESDAPVSLEASPDLVALDDALGALSKVDQRKTKVVELRYFAGLTVEETADVLSVSAVTVMRDWKLAKMWLLRELRRGGSADGPPSFTAQGSE